MAKRKNQAAQALGSLGGRANTPAQMKARRINAQKGGRPHEYRVIQMKTNQRGMIGSARIERRDEKADEGWRRLEQLSPRALDVLAKWMRLNKPTAAVQEFSFGVAYFEKKEK